MLHVSLERNASGQIGTNSGKTVKEAIAKVAIELQEVSFGVNVRFVYRDIPQGLYDRRYQQRQTGGGNLQSDKFDLKGWIPACFTVICRWVAITTSDQDAHVNGTILVSVSDDLYTLNNMVLEVAGNKILTNGTVTASKRNLLDTDIAGRTGTQKDPAVAARTLYRKDRSHSLRRSA